jgi:hypothetical protein
MRKVNWLPKENPRKRFAVVETVDGFCAIKERIKAIPT